MRIITTPRGPMRAVPVAYVGDDSVAWVPVNERDIVRLLHCDLPHFDAATPAPTALYGAQTGTLPSTASIPSCACARSVGGAR